MVLNKVFSKISSNIELFWNIIGSIGIKGLAMIINILSLPAYMNFFSEYEVLGVWFTIISVLNWILTFDLGVGNGLRNLIVKPLGIKDFITVKQYISTSYITIGIIAFLLSVFFVIFNNFINWNKILNIDNGLLSNETLIVSISIIFLAVTLQLFLRLIISILYALQKTAIANFISLFSNFSILICLIFFKKSSISESLIFISYIYFLAINIPLLVATIFVFSTYLKNSRPNIRFYRKEFSVNVVGLGMKFLIIQLSLLIINSSNEFLISKFYSPENVVEYQAYFRIFNLTTVLFSILTIPIWSGITKAFAEGRIVWIKKVQKYLNFTATIFSFCIIFVSIYFEDIVNLWLGNGKVIANSMTVVYFSFYSIILLYIYSANCIANGISKLKPQLFTSLIAALIKIPLIYILFKYFSNWNLIMLVNVLIMLPAVFVQPFVNWKYLKQHK
ncbi:hypothetical protein MM236_10095 [Belliella sp. DSM 107340]|uniref:Na+-driven multidrug efflux pump n=1 Tax=Belliella calami TaxID=2923436 RepID=A0ABS9UNY6_9BACT|nr:hypothetical protein [Belliella calami]MCH7398342.1 hypothetical protein [Belliella calami]